jgi:Tol biopolymer transport system component
VSVRADGTQSRGYSYDPVISGDGRFVVFRSYARDLVLPEVNGYWPQLYIRDLRDGTLRRISDGMGGVPANGGISSRSALSADGRYVTFASWATNLAPGDTNGTDADVFVRDTRTGRIRRVGPGSSPTISGDGRFVAFSTFDAYTDKDRNDTTDIYVRDLVGDQGGLVSAAPDGAAGNGSSLYPAISRDGRSVAFSSHASDLVSGDTNEETDVFVRDLSHGSTRRASVSTAGTAANGYSNEPRISGDGRYVTFYSFASNLVPSDTNDVFDVFIRDLHCGTTRRISAGHAGAQPNGQSTYSAITPDGRFVAFDSAASNLTADPDSNQADDVFLRDLTLSTTSRVSTPLP